jgi:hypothetical protein
VTPEDTLTEIFPLLPLQVVPVELDVTVNFSMLFIVYVLVKTQGPLAIVRVYVPADNPWNWLEFPFTVCCIELPEGYVKVYVNGGFPPINVIGLNAPEELLHVELTIPTPPIVNPLGGVSL